MCLILTKPFGVKIQDKFFEYLENAYRSNRDGVGYALKRAKKDYILVNKGLFKPNEIIKQVEDLNIQPNDQFMIHYRMGTFGSTSVANCHPFIITNIDYVKSESSFLEDLVHSQSILAVNDPIAFCHNGVLSEFSKTFKDANDYSDTRNYARFYLSRKNKTETMTLASLIYEIKRNEFGEDKDFQNAMKENLPASWGQKFAFMSAKYGLLTIGNFPVDKYGYQHSHSGLLQHTNIY